MIRLRILDILTEQNHSKYWLFKRMEMSYQNFNKIVNNETTSIRFDNLEKLSTILDCPIGDLFEVIPEDNTDLDN
ncbi:MAG: helix-turn-helix transcriptional regulator [Lachnospiraceae bacterium]|nr:helix-turn-helix transcriptional regulator [Lachnospiraceae bacterium]